MIQDKNEKNEQAGGITHKKDLNAGSGAFNQGAEQDPDFDKGTDITDEEKATGETPSPGKSKDGDEALRSVDKR